MAGQREAPPPSAVVALRSARRPAPWARDERKECKWGRVRERERTRKRGSVYMYRRGRKEKRQVRRTRIWFFFVFVWFFFFFFGFIHLLFLVSQREKRPLGVPKEKIPVFSFWWEERRDAALLSHVDPMVMTAAVDMKPTLTIIKAEKIEGK